MLAMAGSWNFSISPTRCGTSTAPSTSGRLRFPIRSPPRIVGVNSVELSTIAGRRAEGVNVAWNHPKRTETALVGREGRS